MILVYKVVQKSTHMDMLNTIIKANTHEHHIIRLIIKKILLVLIFSSLNSEHG
jgi:hypothetical protein